MTVYSKQPWVQGVDWLSEVVEPSPSGPQIRRAQKSRQNNEGLKWSLHTLLPNCLHSEKVVGTLGVREASWKPGKPEKW